MEQFERELLGLLPRLRRFARSLTRDFADADDLCQIVLERALKRRVLWQQGTRLDVWIFTIMRNCWIDELRRKRRQSAHLAPAEAADDPSLARAVTPDPVGDMHLYQAMNALPTEQQEAAALVWVEGLSYREAADLLQIPMGTLTSRLVRARRRLMQSLEAT
ncbi:sigma-70 family RNA polymerase sigma factor [Altericroceibacterium xinjiangense]|uniref:sigma-70 family RNA polymerase sigma factor n=1 Tax=Altericroceibacterium xinjiangense TaxID=762261 RepID=UPI000F7D68B3|nr:sigma-70 family RNA polymerase sigma factor [Altericroceibacterium xinjiangense]